MTFSRLGVMRDNQRGFTLIEAMIALAIFATDAMRPAQAGASQADGS